MVLMLISLLLILAQGADRFWKRRRPLALTNQISFAVSEAAAPVDSVQTVLRFY
jgi:hypothetical protein